MKSKLLLFSVFTLCSVNVFAQTRTFYTSYNTFGGIVRDMKKTNDNHLIFFADDLNANVHNLTKIDTLGNIIWQTRLTSPFSQNSFAVVQTTDSGYVALVDMVVSGYGWITVAKVNKNGSFLWAKKCNYSSSSTNEGYDITATENGGFAIIGGGCAGNNFIIKFDVNGNLLWKNQYRDFSRTGSIGQKIIHNPDNSLVVAGATGNNIPYDYKLILFSVDASGNTLWYKVLPFTRMTLPAGLIRTADKGYTVTGYTNAIDTNAKRPFLLHTDSLGNFKWAKYYSHNIESDPADMVQLADGSYILSGTITYSDSRNVQMLNMKTDVNGNIKWGHSSGNIAYSGFGYDGLTCSEWIKGDNFFTAGAADNTIVVKNDSAGTGNCSHDTVLYHVIPLSVTQSAPAITVVPLTFSSDTTKYTASSPGYAINVMCATAVEEVSAEARSIKVFPNPFSSTANIEFQKPVKDARIEIFNIYGQQLKQINHVSGRLFTITRDDLPEGMYFLHITEGDETYITAKLLITNK